MLSNMPIWAIIAIFVVAIALILLDPIARKRGWAKDISGGRKDNYKARFAVLAVVGVVLVVAVLVSR